MSRQEVSYPVSDVDFQEFSVASAFATNDLKQRLEERKPVRFLSIGVTLTEIGLKPEYLNPIPSEEQEH